MLVMLRGFCSCAISGRPTPSPAPKYPLSPIIPVHPRNSPVSPIIPVHTQKQGGGALLLDFQLGILRRMPILSAPAAAGESKDLSRHSPLATRHSPLSPIIPPHTNHSPVSPMIPALTQDIGVGGRSLNGNVSKICRRADILFPARGETQPKNRSREVRDRPLHTLDSGDVVLASATTTAWTGCRNRWRGA